jgi:hypothetical protein
MEAAYPHLYGVDAAAADWSEIIAPVCTTIDPHIMSLHM